MMIIEIVAVLLISSVSVNAGSCLPLSNLPSTIEMVENMTTYADNTNHYFRCQAGTGVFSSHLAYGWAECSSGAWTNIPTTECYHEELVSCSLPSPMPSNTMVYPSLNGTCSSYSKYELRCISGAFIDGTSKALIEFNGGAWINMPTGGCSTGQKCSAPNALPQNTYVYPAITANVSEWAQREVRCTTGIFLEGTNSTNITCFAGSWLNKPTTGCGVPGPCPPPANLPYTIEVVQKLTAYADNTIHQFRCKAGTGENEYWNGPVGSVYCVLGLWINIPTTECYEFTTRHIPPSPTTQNRCEPTLLAAQIFGQCPASNSAQFEVATERNLTTVCEKASQYLICAKSLTEGCPVNGSPVWKKSDSYYRDCCLKTGVTAACPIKISSCSMKPCMNGGTCLQQGGNFTCTCQMGFTGQQCQININECASAPCSSLATCEDLSNGYRCVCPPGFRGSSCTERYYSCTKAELVADALDCDAYYFCARAGDEPERKRCGKMTGIFQLLFDTQTRSCLLPSQFKPPSPYRTHPTCMPP